MADLMTATALATPSAGAASAAPVTQAAAPAVKAAGTAKPAIASAVKAAGAATTGIAGSVLTTAKAAAFSPMVGVIALGGVVAFQWWKGTKDAQKFASAGKS